MTPARNQRPAYQATDGQLRQQERSTPQAHALADRAFLAVLLLGLLARLAFALQPLDRLLIWLEDDAWMVQAIARNFALGHGVSADGITPTNGFHPLYPLLLGSMPYLFDSRPLGWGMPLNLALCAFLGTLALFPLYWLAKRFVAPPLALCSAALAALSFPVIRLSTNGMETSLALLLNLTLLWSFFALERQTLRDGLLLAAVGGLAILARLDATLLVAALSLVWTWQVVRREAPARPYLACGLAISALFGCYLLFNQLVFGNPQPSSGRALSYMHSYADSFSLWNGLAVVTLNPLLPLPLGAPAALGMLAAAAALSLWLVRGPARTLLAVLAIYLVLLATYYGYVLQHTQPRYMVLLGVLTALWLALLLAGAAGRLGRTTYPLALGMLVVVTLLGATSAVGFYRRTAGGPQLTQPAMYAAARWMAAHLPPDAVIGAKNSGIYQFYSERTVRNLDGKLNGEMIPVLEQRELLAYIRAQGIGYLVERPSVLLPWLAQYSAELADVPPHHAPSLRERAAIYLRLALSRLELTAPPDIATRYTGPVEVGTLLDPLASFERANTPGDPVRVYRLAE